MGSEKELWNNDLTQLSTQSWVASWSSGHTVSNTTLLATTKISWYEEFGQSFGWKIKNHRTAFKPMHFCGVLKSSLPPGLLGLLHVTQSWNSAPSFQNSHWAHDAADAPKDVGRWSRGGPTYAMPQTVPYFWPSFPFFLRFHPGEIRSSKLSLTLQTVDRPAPAVNLHIHMDWGTLLTCSLFGRSIVLRGPYGSEKQNIQNDNPTKHSVFIVIHFFFFTTNPAITS